MTAGTGIDVVLEVRSGDAGDWDSVLDLFDAVREAEPGYTVTASPTRQAVAAWMAVPDGGRWWVATHDGRVVGTVSTAVVPPPCGTDETGSAWWELRRLAVHPDVQGRGVGSVLTAAVRAEAAAERVQVWLCCRPHRVTFYERCG